MGLLDALFDPSLYSGQGGLLSRLQPMIGQLPQSQGFPDAQPNPISVGGYQMPRVGNADLYQPQQVMTPPAAQPTQGQLPQQMETPPTFLNNQGGLAAGFRGFANNLHTGPLGALVGGIGSALGVQDPAQQNLQAQYQSLYGALKSNGVADQEARSKAMLAVMNPEAAKTILPELFTSREKFQKIGQDPLTGIDQYGFVNERDQTINGKPQTAQPSSSSAIGDPTLTGDAYLQSLPESIRSQVKAIVEGRMQPPSGFALKSPQIQSLMRAAAQYEPGFDLTKWSQRSATAKDFASGMAAKNVTSLNTVIGHLSDLKEKADALNNWSVPAINTVKNAFYSMTGNPEVNNFNLARNAVADELAKVFKGSGISDHEIAQWKGTLNDAQSPAQLKGAVKTAISLMDSRLSALNDQRDRGMATQTEPRSLLNEKSKAGLAKIEEWANSTDSKPSSGVDRSAIEAEMRRRGLLK